MSRLLRIQRQIDGAVAPAFVIDGMDAHFAGLSGAVDDPDKSLLARVVGRGDQRNGVRQERRLAKLATMCAVSLITRALLRTSSSPAGVPIRDTSGLEKYGWRTGQLLSGLRT